MITSTACMRTTAVTVGRSSRADTPSTLPDEAWTFLSEVL